MNGKLQLQAPAKINLVLRVLSRRTDGYHELETWMQKLDIYDEVTLEVREGGGIELHCDNDEIPQGKENLAWKAAATFLKECTNGKKYGVAIRLKKRIPVAAGLGGGSSDAGTVLKGLNRLFHDIFSQKELVKMGLMLGADVPFFVTDYDAVLATGIGEIMSPVASIKDTTFLLVNGGFAVSTRWVFEKFALTRAGKDSIMTGFYKLNPDSMVLSDLVNELEQVTIRRYPEIAEIKEQLVAAGADKVLMSGSGPTVFGIFPDRQKKQQKKIVVVAEMLRRKYGTQVFIARACTGV